MRTMKWKSRRWQRLIYRHQHCIFYKLNKITTNRSTRYPPNNIRETTFRHWRAPLRYAPQAKKLQLPLLRYGSNDTVQSVPQCQSLFRVPRAHTESEKCDSITSTDSTYFMIFTAPAVTLNVAPMMNRRGDCLITIIRPDVDCNQPQIFAPFHEEYVCLLSLHPTAYCFKTANSLSFVCR